MAFDQLSVSSPFLTVDVTERCALNAGFACDRLCNRPVSRDEEPDAISCPAPAGTAGVPVRYEITVTVCDFLEMPPLGLALKINLLFHQNKTKQNEKSFRIPFFIWSLHGPVYSRTRTI